MAGYTFKGKTYKFKAVLPLGITLYSNSDDDLKKEINKRLGNYRDAWTWSSSDNGYSYRVHEISKEKPKKQDPAKVRNMRRNNYNEQAKRYGFNSRDEVRKMQRVLKKLGYKLGYHGPNKDGIDGYMGNFTMGAYLDAWLHHPEEMEAAGFKKPEAPGVGTVKAGNRTVVDTDLNMRVASDIKAADDYVGLNFDSAALFNMYTLGLSLLLSPSSLIGTAKQAYDVVAGNSTASEILNNWLTGNNAGIFELTPEMKQWMDEHPREAAAINMLVDITVGVGAKGMPKVKAAGRAVTQNVKNAAVTAAENMNPRMSVSRYSYANVPRGNSRINLSAARNALVSPGLLTVSDVTPSGRVVGSWTGSGMGSPVATEMTYSQGAMPFYVSPGAYASTVPMGEAAIVNPYHGVQFDPYTMQIITPGIFTLGGEEAPALENYYTNPNALMPDATKFKNGGVIEIFRKGRSISKKKNDIKR